RSLKLGSVQKSSLPRPGCRSRCVLPVRLVTHIPHPRPRIDRVCQALERLATHANKVPAALVLRAIKCFRLDVTQVHYDITHVGLFGAYELKVSDRAAHPLLERTAFPLFVDSGYEKRIPAPFSLSFHFRWTPFTVRCFQFQFRVTAGTPRGVLKRFDTE